MRWPGLVAQLADVKNKYYYLGDLKGRDTLGDIRVYE
jgi:hypothetical protein